MKKKHNIVILIIIIFGIIGCISHPIKNAYIGNWIEVELEFSEAISFQEKNDLLEIITSEKFSNQFNKKYNWLRNEKNLLMTFHILQNLGLKRILSENQYKNKRLKSKDWSGLTLNEVVKKMITSYEKKLDSSNYYYKFWKRRKLENNNKTVLNIFKEIDTVYNHQKKFKINTIDDSKLFNLIKQNIELNESNLEERRSISLSYFDYLKKINLHHSAYNLIFELEITQNLSINKDSLLQKLSFDTIPEKIYWQKRNNAKWIRTYRDNGP